MLMLVFAIISSVVIYGCAQQRTETKQDTSTDVTKQGKARVSLLDTEIMERNGQKYIVDPSKIEAVLPRDAIPAILEPKFVKAGEADFISDEEYVLGVFVGNEAKAYPIKILNYHEIVNDAIGGTNVIVTYCPLCGTGLSFIRDLDRKTYTFGVSGKLYNSDLVMYDHQTETYWTQALGLGIVGPLTKKRLTPIITDTIKWKEWKAKHPDTLVLSTDTGFIRNYERDPYEGYDRSSRIWFPIEVQDDRLFSKARVYGIMVNGESKAYPEDIIKKKKVINDFVGNKNILVVVRDDGTVRFFSKDELPIKDQQVMFSIKNGKLTDTTGSEWDFDGNALSGELKGNKMPIIVADYLFWFAWANFHPDTGLYS